MRPPHEAVRVHALHTGSVLVATASPSIRTTCRGEPASSTSWTASSSSSAGDINLAHAPVHVVDLVAEALNDRGKAIRRGTGRDRRRGLQAECPGRSELRRGALEPPPVIAEDEAFRLLRHHDHRGSSAIWPWGGPRRSFRIESAGLDGGGATGGGVGDGPTEPVSTGPRSTRRPPSSWSTRSTRPTDTRVAERQVLRLGAGWSSSPGALARKRPTSR